MKIMRAKVINCSGKDYWYKDLVGNQIYCLKCYNEWSPFIYEMIFTDCKNMAQDPSRKCYFNKDDLLVLEEFDGELITYSYVEIVRKTNETTQS